MRDWEIVEQADGNRTAIPADLTRTAGQAFILHTKICKNEKTYVSRYGDQDIVGFANSLPKWMPQVRDRLERLALNDDNAREVLAALMRGEAKEKEGKLVPGSEGAASAASAADVPRQSRSYQVDFGESDPLP